MKKLIFAIIFYLGMVGLGNAQTLTVAPNPTSPGQAVTATFAGVANPTSTDWLGLYNQGAANNDFLGWVYTATCTKTAGTPRNSGACIFPIPQTVGNYQLRLLAADGFSVVLAAIDLSIVNIPPNTIPVMAMRINTPGDYSCPQTNVPLGITRAIIDFTPGEQVKAGGLFYGVVMRNLLGGGPAVWETIGGFSHVGDGITGISPEVIELPEPSNSGRVLRCTFTLYGQDWNGAAFITLE